jgi:putative component of toxin-antitoxin plasmid stabilization module
MKFEVTSESSAEYALKNLRDRHASERIARAVHELSVRGVGDVRRRGTSQTEFTLHVDWV